MWSHATGVIRKNFLTSESILNFVLVFYFGKNYTKQQLCIANFHTPKIDFFRQINTPGAYSKNSGTFFHPRNFPRNVSRVAFSMIIGWYSRIRLNRFRLSRPSPNPPLSFCPRQSLQYMESSPNPIINSVPLGWPG